MNMKKRHEDTLIDEYASISNNTSEVSLHMNSGNPTIQKIVDQFENVIEKPKKLVPSESGSNQRRRLDRSNYASHLSSEPSFVGGNSEQEFSETETKHSQNIRRQEHQQKMSSNDKKAKNRSPPIKVDLKSSFRLKILSYTASKRRKCS
jgi:hypothetical protein